MTIARRQLVDLSVSRWYHFTSRCVRRAFLLAEGPSNRKEWIENRIKELAEIFAVGIGGFSVMDGHQQMLLRLDPDVAQGWSDEDVVRSWGRLFPPRDNSRKPLCLTASRWGVISSSSITPRLFREGKARISADVAGVFKRPGSRADD